MNHWTCPADSEERFDDPPASQFCPTHDLKLELSPYQPHDAHQAAPDKAPAPAPKSVVAKAKPCWRCEFDVPVHSQRCPACASPVRPPTLVIRVDGGKLITLDADEQATLGRDPAWSPHAEMLQAFGNVHRKHAVIGVDSARNAWIRAQIPPAHDNGTFVSERRIPLDVAYPLQDGDTVRLAKDFIARVRLYRQEANPDDRR